MDKEILKKYCASLGLDRVGIAPIGPYRELEVILTRQRQQGYFTEFEDSNVAKRTDPRLTMEDAQSIVVCLFPYCIGTAADANLSKYTYSRDYHQVAGEMLNQIGSYLAECVPGLRFQAFADTGPLADRYLAYLAGLGFYGINSHLITETYGSYFFIGYLITNYPFAPDRPLERTCAQCGACVKACPGQIIKGDFCIDPRLCRSYVTQKKGMLTEQEIAVLKKTPLIFGCDVCQDVCPHNRQISRTPLPDFQKEVITRLRRDELAAMSNKQFTQAYGRHAFSWRGKKILIRNLKLLEETPENTSSAKI